MNEQTTKSAFVAIVGKPNAGKSSLLNRLVGEKIAITSPRPQTTRTRITGVLTEEETQLVFIDTPGLHKAKNKLGEYMVKQVDESIGDVDCAVLVSESFGEIKEAEQQLMESLSSRHIPTILALNKIDLLEDKSAMVPKLLAFQQQMDFVEIIPISVVADDGIDLLMAAIKKLAPEGPHFFPEDTLTDQPEKVIAGEIIREKVLTNMRDEIPHGCAVIIEQMRERPQGNIIDMDATILCEKQSHKGMIIGKQGAMLKKIGSEARLEMEAFFDCKFNLKLWVKVREDWRNSASAMKDLGFN